jgi:alpha-galactosidase
MAENLYIQGLYRLWDELLRRHPNLWIDNCASGGRRIDLETLSRSLPLWPTDFHDTPGLATGMNLHVGDQCENAGLARWVPLFGGGVWNFEPYSVRSQAIGGFLFGTHIAFEHYRAKDDPAVFSFPAIAERGKTLLGEGFPMELAKAAIAEHNSLQPYVIGDFWPLLPLTASPHDWCAFQLHRHDLNAGFALFFRRHQSPFDSMPAALRWIDPAARYKVTLSAGYDPSPEQVMIGRQLLEVTVRIDPQPGSMLLRYQKQGG